VRTISLADWIVFGLTLVSGTFAGISNKYLYATCADGLHGQPNLFQKAYFFTLLMFIGEALCLVLYFYKKWQKAREDKEKQQYQLMHGSADEESSLADPNAPKPPSVWFFLFLSCFDCSATATGGVGLKWVSASVNQMLRGSMILFTGLFSVSILGRKLRFKQWLGIGVVCLALVIVGVSSAMDKAQSSSSDATGGQVALGLFLVILGSALNSAQNVLEERTMKGAAPVDPLAVVGWEGVFGSLICICILLPVMQFIPGDDQGSQENTIDTLLMFSRSPTIILCSLGYVISLAVMNYYSQRISISFSAVHRMLINTMRTVFIWVVDIMIYYLFGGKTASAACGSHKGQTQGEFWDDWSFLQLFGFAVLVAGTFIYMRARDAPIALDGHSADESVNNKDNLKAPLMA
jgi:drug/metabolite transporter (DMT)-like permease